MSKYGMQFSTIRYFQNQAADLWRYNGIVLGAPTFDPHNLARASAQRIGHDAIAMAAVLPVANVRAMIGPGSEYRADARGLSVQLGTRTFRIRENAYGNWYGYIGTRRVELFLGSSFEQERAARQWLDDMQRTYPNRPRNAR